MPKQVLNGHIFAMWRLWDLYRVAGDTEARALFERAGATLIRTGIAGDLRSADRGDAWALMKSDPGSFGSLSISGLAPVPEGLPPDALE